jgi:signal transduction histidine kinase
VYRFPLFTPGGVTRIVNVTRSPLTGGSAGEQVYTLDDVGEEVRREEILERQSHLASMGLIASQVAHEVNTPLTGIASYAQILMSRLRVRPSEMAMLRRIESQAFQAAGIAGSVLNYARRRTGEEPRRIEAGALVAECLSLFEAHIKGKRIRVRSERSPDLPEIVARPGRIQQLILNLLLNAAAALPGGGEVRVEVDREGSALRIRVSDDGVGIPPEIRPRIFEPFFTSRPDGQGTGLGLWVVDQIVREHRGEIRVESAPGAGTRFSVLIPAAGGAEETIAHGA